MLGSLVRMPLIIALLVIGVIGLGIWATANWTSHPESACSTAATCAKVIAKRPIDPTLEKINALSETARNCLGMYLKYGDEKVSNLTMSQIQGIETCQSLGLYHDLQ